MSSGEKIRLGIVNVCLVLMAASFILAIGATLGVVIELILADLVNVWGFLSRAIGFAIAGILFAALAVILGTVDDA
jgi:hypothetical protein